MLTWLTSSPAHAVAAIAVSSVVAGGAGAGIAHIVETRVLVTQVAPDDSQPPKWMQDEHARISKMMRDDTAAMRRMTGQSVR